MYKTIFYFYFFDENETSHFSLKFVQMLLYTLMQKHEVLI